MKKKKTTISQANSINEIAEFWENHDLSDFWHKTKPADFKVESLKNKRNKELNE